MDYRLKIKFLHTNILGICDNFLKYDVLSRGNRTCFSRRVRIILKKKIFEIFSHLDALGRLYFLLSFFFFFFSTIYENHVAILISISSLISILSSILSLISSSILSSISSSILGLI